MIPKRLAPERGDDIARSTGKLVAVYGGDKMYCVYQIVNSVTGKKYYGIAKNPKRRLASHKWAATKGFKKSPLYTSIRKHGWDKFSMEILHKGLEPEEAGNKEIELISQDDCCYNLHLGGKTGFDIRLLPEDRQADWKRKLSEKRRGRKPALGMVHTKENREFFRQVSNTYWQSQQTYSLADINKLPFREASTKFGISKTHYYRLRKRDKSNDLI